MSKSPIWTRLWPGAGRKSNERPPEDAWDSIFQEGPAGAVARPDSSAGAASEPEWRDAPGDYAEPADAPERRPAEAASDIDAAPASDFYGPIGEEPVERPAAPEKRGLFGRKKTKRDRIEPADDGDGLFRKASQPDPVGDQGVEPIAPAKPRKREKTKYENVSLADFDFDLPEDRIALAPMRPRDAARLLEVRPGGELADKSVVDLPLSLRRGDVLVVNDTRVLPAALVGVRPARDEAGENVTVDLNLTEPLGEDGWRAFARPAKRLKEGDVINLSGGVTATVEAKGDEGAVDVRFNRAGEALTEALETIGAPPLPPYIARKRAVSEADRADYQTMFAAEPGAVAAPTAGLHFTPDLIAALGRAGVELVHVTLHVGPGTFLPVKDEDVNKHTLFAERCRVDQAAARAINTAKLSGGRVVAVGTTAMRTLETAADPDGTVRPFNGETDLFIRPGYAFKAVDALMTNFHLPKSTLFMLVCAFAGTETMKAAYAHAITERYRFYSYGDACLLHRRKRR